LLADFHGNKLLSRVGTQSAKINVFCYLRTVLGCDIPNFMLMLCSISFYAEFEVVTSKG